VELNSQSDGGYYVDAGSVVTVDNNNNNNQKNQNDSSGAGHLGVVYALMLLGVLLGLLV